MQTNNCKRKKKKKSEMILLDLKREVPNVVPDVAV